MNTECKAYSDLMVKLEERRKKELLSKQRMKLEQSQSVGWSERWKDGGNLNKVLRPLTIGS